MKRFFNAYSGPKIAFAFFLIISGIFGSAFFSSQRTFAGSQHNLSGYAWSDNIGWISFNSSNCDSNNDGKSDGTSGCPTSGTTIPNYGVNIEANNNLSGYAWSDNIGWIKFNVLPFTGENYPEIPYYSAKIDANNKITGWTRACSGTQNSDCNSASRTDGWDGWIKMADTKYGVTQNTKTIPKELENWAWGRTAMGWLSFNCQNQNSCSVSDYKVRVAQGPPKVTTSTQTWNHCAIYKTSLPSFSWGYSGDNSQSGYEVRIDNDQVFFDNQNNSIFDADEFYCGKTQGGENVVCNGGGSAAFVPPTTEWQNWMQWNAKYWWTVRVKDQQERWSSWTTPQSFKTPLNAYPWVEFTWSEIPQKLQEIQFTNSSQAFSSPKWAPAPEPDLPPPGASALWTFSDAIPSTSNFWSPLTTFSSVGQKSVTLKVTDYLSYFCQGSVSVNAGQAGSSSSIKRYQFIEL